MPAADVRRVTRAGATELGIGGQRRAGMARHFNLGHDRDMAGRGVGDELTNVGLGVIAPVAPVRPVGGAGLGVKAEADALAPGADCRQAWILLDLDAPALVVRQVQLEVIQFVQRH